MRVIGIDPGYDRLGVAIVEKQNGRDTVVFSTCIETDKRTGLPERLAAAGESLTTILRHYRPDTLGIETLFFNKNVKTAIGVAQARGVVLFLAKQVGCQVVELSPQQVKIAVTGYGGSDKTAIMGMLKRIIDGVPAQALDDEYDAIAVASATLAQLRPLTQSIPLDPLPS